MKNSLLIVVGVVIAIVGVFWALQGYGVVGGSFMSGNHTFEVVGAHTFGQKLTAFVSQKDLEERGLIERPPYIVVESFWQHRYVQNRGAAFSFLASVGEKIRVPFFQFITLCALVEFAALATLRFRRLA